jgi:hypothetical protein
MPHAIRFSISTRNGIRERRVIAYTAFIIGVGPQANAMTRPSRRIRARDGWRSSHRW